MATAFDYTSAFGQQGGPFGSLSQGLQLGAQLAQADQQTALREAQTAKIQQELAANQAKAVQQQKLGEAYTLLVDKVRSDTWQPADFQGVALLAPKEQSEAAIKFFDTLSKDRQAQVLSSTTQVMAALGSKNPEIGVEVLNQRAEGFRKRGDEGQARFLETQAKLAAIDPALVVATLGDTLIGLPGGKEAIESLAKRNEDRRAAALAPFKLREQTATTLIKEAEAKFAPDKFGADLNLTNAQIEAAKAARRASDAAAAKSGADAVRARAEADQLSAGVIPADKRPEAESKFRKEYSDQTKGYQEVKSAYGRILASEDTAVGDLSLIFGYMKMLDPGSVVREGEFATAENAQGVPDRILNIYNRVRTGERLSPSQRDSFKGQAGKLYSTAQTQEGQVRQGIERIAKGYGLNTANIFYQAIETPPKGGEPSAAIPGAPVKPGQIAPAGPRVGTPGSLGGAMPGVPAATTDIRSQADLIIRGGR